MTKSQTALRRDIDNEPGDEEEANLQQLCEQVLFLLLLRLVRPSVSQVTSYHAHDPNSSSCNTQQQQHQQRQQQQQQQTLNKSTVEIPISLPHHNLYADETKNWH